jgi:hypothetical protein
VIPALLIPRSRIRIITITTAVIPAADITAIRTTADLMAADITAAAVAAGIIDSVTSHPPGR